MTKSALFSVRKMSPRTRSAGRTGDPFRETLARFSAGFRDYPDCDYIRPLKSQADGISLRCWRQECPSWRCGYGVTPGRFGMFIGCSRYPECEHTELIDKTRMRRLSLARSAEQMPSGPASFPFR